MSGFDHFNFLGPIYDRIFGQKKDHKIVELADVRSGQALLDLGGGTGRVTVLFTSITQKLLIADTAMKMLWEAQQKGIRTVNSQSERLPFTQGSFDRILMVDALHHVEDQQKTLAQMWRVLASGGKIVIEEPDIHHFLVKLVALGEKLLLMRSHFLTPRAIADMCRFDKHASVEIYYEKGMAWIIITRQPHEQ